MNVLILGDSFLSWTGGASLIGYITRSLIKGAEITQDKVIFALSSRLLADPTVCDATNISIPRAGISATGSFETFFSECDNLKEIFFYKELNRLITERNIDVIAPTGMALGLIECPWLGYIPDFQHQYLPHFFSSEERMYRDKHFRLIAEGSDGIYVNSQSVALDVENFYPGFFPPKKIFRFPRLASRVSSNIGSASSAIEKFNISKNYFISCSQRWMHKQHDLIIEAFELFCQKNPELKFDLVFTGSENDYRNDQFSQEIERKITQSPVANRIKSLGLIDRQDQINLISECRALVQASIFEGGPGASGTLEAALMGRVVIASDIKPNLELNKGTVLYFRSRDVEDLYQKLLAVSQTVEANDRNSSSEKSLDTKRRDYLDTSAGLNMLEEFKHVVLSRRRNT